MDEVSRHSCAKISKLSRYVIFDQTRTFRDASESSGFESLGLRCSQSEQGAMARSRDRNSEFSATSYPVRVRNQQSRSTCHEETGIVVCLCVK